MHTYSYLLGSVYYVQLRTTTINPPPHAHKSPRRFASAKRNASDTYPEPSFPHPPVAYETWTNHAHDNLHLPLQLRLPLLPLPSSHPKTSKVGPASCLCHSFCFFVLAFPSSFFPLFFCSHIPLHSRRPPHPPSSASPPSAIPLPLPHPLLLWLTHPFRDGPAPNIMVSGPSAS